MAAVVSSATLASLAMVGNSRAGTVATYNFTLNDFVDIIGSSPSPITSISGSFTLTFDPSVSYVDNTTNITGSITGIPNAPVVNSTIRFDTFVGTPYGIAIGGIYGGADLIYSNTNDFILELTFANAASLADPSIAVCGGPGLTCGNYTGSNAVYAAGYSETGPDSVGSRRYKREPDAAARRSPALGWWLGRSGSARLAQEAEEHRCYRGRLSKTPYRISERPPHFGGLSFCADHAAVRRLPVAAHDDVSLPPQNLAVTGA